MNNLLPEDTDKLAQRLYEAFYKALEIDPSAPGYAWAGLPREMRAAWRAAAAVLTESPALCAQQESAQEAQLALMAQGPADGTTWDRLNENRLRERSRLQGMVDLIRGGKSDA